MSSDFEREVLGLIMDSLQANLRKKMESEKDTEKEVQYLDFKQAMEKYLAGKKINRKIYPKRIPCICGECDPSERPLFGIDTNHWNLKFLDQEDIEATDWFVVE